jgi:hypothetical protein
VGGRLAAAWGLLALGGLTHEPAKKPTPAGSGSFTGEFQVSPASAERFPVSRVDAVWPPLERVNLADAWESPAGDGGDDRVEDGVEDWTVRPVYLKWEAGAELNFTKPGDDRRFQYTIDPTFGMQDRLPTIKGMMIRFRVDF